MKDYANRRSINKRREETKKNVFRSKKKSIQVVSLRTFGGLIMFSAVLMAISIFYFGTDIETFKPRQPSNNVTINFPTSLMENSILIESNIDERFLDCEYFVQVGAYGNKKYAYEAKEALEEIKFITINNIYSSSNPGKLLHSVLSGPYENRSAANNAKEKVTKRGFEPQLRTLCKKS
jgi:hypothetical protein